VAQAMDDLEGTVFNVFMKERMLNINVFGASLILGIL
jgi:hypothetical protein